MSHPSRTYSLAGCAGRYAIIVSSLVAGCGGQVDLGSSSVTFTAPGQDRLPSEQLAVGTTSLIDMNYMLGGGLGIDDSYLYLNACSSNTTNCQIVRCDKANCLPTIKPIHEFSRPGEFGRGFWQHAGMLGWFDPSVGLEMCHTPDCTDFRAVPGLTIDAHAKGMFDHELGDSGPNACLTPSLALPVVWDADHVYWFLANDNAIYRCDLPDCQNGPASVASSVVANELILVGDELYWLDGFQGIMRTAKDGSGTPQRLSDGDPAKWDTPLHFERSSYPDGTQCSAIAKIAVDGPYVYAMTIDYNLGSSAVTRWDYTHPEVTEILNESSNSAGIGSLLSAYGGEVWYGDTSGTWSCLADDCASTRRLISQDGIFDDFEGSIITVADEQNFYWLRQHSDESAAYTLERTARLTPP